MPISFFLDKDCLKLVAVTKGLQVSVVADVQSSFKLSGFCFMRDENVSAYFDFLQEAELNSDPFLRR